MPPDAAAIGRAYSAPVNASNDARVLLFTRTLRSFSDGFVSVLLAGYLAQLGFSDIRVGAVATATLLGTALATLLVGAAADRVGRRRLLFAAALLACGTGLAFAAASGFVIVLLIAVIGTLNPTAGDVSVFLPVEQAMLPQTVDPAGRTRLFARYNLAGALAAATGALAAAVPSLLHRWFGWPLLDVMRSMFVLYGALALVNLAAYRTLSPAVGFSVPMTAISNTGTKALDEANATPVAAASSVAARSTRRRPRRSVTAPTISVATAVPSSVAVATAPTRTPEKPSCAR